MQPDPFDDLDSRFSKPDLTGMTLKAWLRGTEDLTRQPPEPEAPSPTPSEPGWRIGHIAGFP